MITTQSGAYDLSVAAGAGDDSISVTGVNLTSADTIDGGGNTDTILLAASGATIEDADFTNIDNVEKFTTAGGSNNLTLGTKAADALIATVTGGDGNDTINASGFDAVLTISSGSGDDVITAQSGARPCLLMRVLEMMASLLSVHS